jgi:hypothetical protein
MWETHHAKPNAGCFEPTEWSWWVRLSTEDGLHVASETINANHDEPNQANVNSRLSAGILKNMQHGAHWIFTLLPVSILSPSLQGNIGVRVETRRIVYYIGNLRSINFRRLLAKPHCTPNVSTPMTRIICAVGSPGFSLLIIANSSFLHHYI